MLNNQQQQLVKEPCSHLYTLKLKACLCVCESLVSLICAAYCISSVCICFRAVTCLLCKLRLQPYDLSRTAEVFIIRALPPLHPCFSTPQTPLLSSLGPPDKLPPCLKVGHYRPPEYHRAPHWALIAISRSSSPVLYWRPEGGWRV